MCKYYSSKSFTSFMEHNVNSALKHIQPGYSVFAVCIMLHTCKQVSTLPLCIEVTVTIVLRARITNHLIQDTVLDINLQGSSSRNIRIENSDTKFWIVRFITEMVCTSQITVDVLLMMFFLLLVHIHCNIRCRVLKMLLLCVYFVNCYRDTM